MNDSTSQSTLRWTWLGLAIALFAVPILAAGFRNLLGPMTASIAVGRELTIFAAAGLLLWIVRRREGRALESVGFTGASAGQIALWTLIAVVACVAALAIGLVAVNLLDLRFGSAPGTVQTRLPLWVQLIVVLRAGIVEELFYRGYAINRLQHVSGSNALAVSVSLLVFAGFHYGQGAGGVLIALLMGIALTGVYLWKRNVVAVMLAHFLVDFIPNIVLPLLSGD
ncbi:MAG TPA: CPBP family intramembrane glutamic endopeptidase [Povalibacter sp.]